MTIRTSGAGPMDRLVAIENKVVVRDPQFGSETVTWAVFATVWAAFDEMAIEPTTNLGQNEGIAALYLPTKVRVRWLPGINTTMRINDSGKLWQVTGLAMVGRNEWLDLACRDWQHE